MKCFVVVAVLLTGIQSASTIRCYECEPNFTNFSSVNMCNNPTDTINCTNPYHDSCFSIRLTGLTGNVTDFAKFTFHSLNCTTKLLCDKNKNSICDLLKNDPGFKLENCDISCCQRDLCNNPILEPSPSSFPRITPPIPSTGITINISPGCTNCALLVILLVIPLVVMNIF